MQIPPFELDRWLAAHEFASSPIRYNLAASTGPPWTLGELSALGGNALRQELESLRLSYAPPEGCRLLRERIADVYQTDPDCLIVTAGAAEALSMLLCLAAEPEGSVVLPLPAYPAMPAMAKAWGMRARHYVLDRAADFAQTAGSILSTVDATTRLVVVNTPHTPTGSVMPWQEIAHLAASLAERGIPLLVDEVYHPLYFGAQHPSAADIPNTLVVGDLSKALSLPGLRVGWIIDRDAKRRERLIDLRSYFTVSGSPVTEAIAAHALAHRGALLSRLNAVARANMALLERFMHAHREHIGWVRPAGGTVSFPWLLDGRDARPLCQALARAGVLVVPGDCFGAAEHFRIGVGAQAEGFERALDIASRVVSSSGA